LDSAIGLYIQQIDITQGLGATLPALPVRLDRQSILAVDCLAIGA